MYIYCTKKSASHQHSVIIIFIITVVIIIIIISDGYIWKIVILLITIAVARTVHVSEAVV